MADMRALTVRQPWCWSISHGGKLVENRGRQMKYRGPLWLHAGARSRWDTAGADSLLVQQAWLGWLTGNRGKFNRSGAYLPATNIRLTRGNEIMPFGAVAALAEVAGCHHADYCDHLCPDWDGLLCAEHEGVCPQRLLCSPWAISGQWHIALANVRALPEPIPCRGALGLWRLPEDVEAQARKQLEAHSDRR